jgi:hypothetical protein
MGFNSKPTNITPFKPSNPGGYKPDQLSSGPASGKPLVEAGTPKTGSIVPTLLKIALRRIPGFGFGAVHGKAPSTVKQAVTMGSHGNLK